MRQAIRKTNENLKNQRFKFLFWFNLFAYDAIDYFETNKNGLTGDLIKAENIDYMNRFILATEDLVFPEFTENFCMENILV